MNVGTAGGQPGSSNPIGSICWPAAPRGMCGTDASWVPAGSLTPNTPNLSWAAAQAWPAPPPHHTSPAPPGLGLHGSRSFIDHKHQRLFGLTTCSDSYFFPSLLQFWDVPWGQLKAGSWFTHPQHPVVLAVPSQHEPKAHHYCEGRPLASWLPQCPAQCQPAPQGWAYKDKLWYFSSLAWISLSPRSHLHLPFFRA